MAQAAGVRADAQALEAPGQRLGEAAANEARRWEVELVVVGTHVAGPAVLLRSGAE